MSVMFELPPVSIVQITDLHIKQPGALTYGKVDTADFLRRAVVSLNAIVPRPDAVVITGDLVDQGQEVQYQHLHNILADLQIPYYLLVGNHDARQALRKVYPESTYLHEGPKGDDGECYIQYGVDIGPVRFLALDSLVVGKAGGALCASRLQWLEKALSDAKDRPVVIGLHHPPFATGIGHMDGSVLDDDATAGLAAIVSRYPNVERVIAGHIHREIHARFAGTMASTAGSTAHQVCLDLRPDAPDDFTMEPPSFVIHRWTAATGLVSHLGYIGNYAGPFPFRDGGGALLD
jgi:3',5'-cyclic AMP phosphodiesterase CpdA